MTKSLSVILVLGLAATCITAKTIPLPIEPGAVNVLLVYTHTSTDEFYVRSDQALASYDAINGFSFLDTNLGDGTIFLQYYSNRQYWQVRASDSKLILTTSTSTRTPLLLVPIAEGSNEFTISANGIPLVTSQSVAPFDFHLQTRYPNEPPATFRFIQEFDLRGSYNNNRANLNRTVDLLSASTTTNKEAAYKLLVDLMANNGHFSGAEVFYVAYNLREDIGNLSEAFRALPPQVQFLSANPELDLKLFYAGPAGNLSIPMKYVAASDSHTNVLPYQFYYRPSHHTWGATYGQVHNLYVPGISPHDLLERTDGIQEQKMIFSMHEDLQRFTISALISSSGYRWWALAVRVNTPVTTFYATSSSPVYFYVLPYVA